MRAPPLPLPLSPKRILNRSGEKQKSNACESWDPENSECFDPAYNLGLRESFTMKRALLIAMMAMAFLADAAAGDYVGYDIGFERAVHTLVR
jgi:hypothetical protein